MALCRLLLERPTCCLLDEPTNHLDAETVAWLQKHLSDYPGTLLIVTHDRYFLDEITGWILELDRGRGIPYRATIRPGSSRRPSGSSRRRARTRRAKALARELRMDPRSPRARQAKSKARIRAYDELASQSERERMGRAQIIIPPGPRLGRR
ncbi:MAG: hypothetical protein KatS3mg118_2364 [Paracoccaceae bacterium]|nr:MAG: hypothetical protein KatS3mg118_2364 [Paracoccaceae bacterium]